MQSRKHTFKKQTVQQSCIFFPCYRTSVDSTVKVKREPSAMRSRIILSDRPWDGTPNFETNPNEVPTLETQRLARVCSH